MIYTHNETWMTRNTEDRNLLLAMITIIFIELIVNGSNSNKEMP